MPGADICNVSIPPFTTFSAIYLTSDGQLGSLILSKVVGKGHKSMLCLGDETLE